MLAAHFSDQCSDFLNPTPGRITGLGKSESHQKPSRYQKNKVCLLDEYILRFPDISLMVTDVYEY